MKLFLLISLFYPNMLLLGKAAQDRVVTPRPAIAQEFQNPRVDPRTAQTVPIIFSQFTTTSADEKKVLVHEVVVKTASGQPLPPEIEKKVYEVSSTRPGLTTTRTQLQSDINAVFATGFFFNVQAKPEDTKNGVRVTFVVMLNPVLKAVNTQGTKVLEPSAIDRIFGSQIGKITNLKDIQAGVKALEKYYQDKGYALAQIIDIKAQPDGTVTLVAAEGEVEDIKVAYLNEERKTQDKDGKPIVGNTPSSVILREVSLKRGDVFNKSKVQSDLQRVFELGFEDINLGLAPGTDPHKVVVTINVKELRGNEDATKLFETGNALADSGDYAAAIYSHQQLLEKYRKLGNRRREWLALLNLGNVYQKWSDYPKALSYYEQALTIVRELKDRNNEALVLIALGAGYLPIGDYPIAVKYWEQALSISQEREGLSRLMLVFGYGVLGDHSKAIPNLQKVLVLTLEDNKNNREFHRILTSISKDIPTVSYSISLVLSAYKIFPTFYTNGDKTEFGIQSKGTFDDRDQDLELTMIAYFEKSLETAIQDKDRDKEMFILSLLSWYFFQSDSSKAIAYLEKVLAITQSLNEPKYEAIVLVYLAHVYTAKSDYAKAIGYLEKVLTIIPKLKDPKYEAIALGALGYAYQTQGDSLKAIAYYEKALKIVQGLNIPSYEALALSILGFAYRNNGDDKKGFVYLAKASEIYQRGVNESDPFAKELGRLYKIEPSALIALVKSDKGVHAKIIAYLEQYLAISQKRKERESEVYALSNLAMEYAKLGDPKEIVYLEQLFAIYQQQVPKDRSKPLRELGEKYADLGKYPQALLLFQKSVSILKEIGDRSEISNVFIDLGDLLIKQKQAELAVLYYKQAINTIESIRGDIRQLGKQQQRSYVGKIQRTYRKLASLLLQQGRVTEALQVLDLLKVQELEDYFKTFQGTDATTKGIPLLPAEQSAINNNLSQEQLANLNQQLATALKQEIATERDRIPDTLRQLSNGSALLYPVLLDDRLELVLFMPGQPPIHRSVAVKPAQIQKEIEEFRADLQDPSSLDVMVPSQKLYDWLLRPLVPDMERSNITTILYAPDKQLRYVPLAALHDGKQWVVERYQVGYLIAYNLADFKGAVPKTPRILAGALGKNSYFGLAPLPATLTEVESIATSIPETLNLLQDNFTRQTIQQNLQGRTILHLATHAEFREGRPDESFILMGNGDKLTLSDLRDWQLPGVDLVVLSACQTGLGKTGQGIEILGFGYQMQLVGAKGTLSSLWSVSDGGTGVLMDGFYRQFSQTPNSLAALRNAQLTMIRQGDSLTGERKRSYEALRSGLPLKVQGRLNHPYYWAAFIAIQNRF